MYVQFQDTATAKLMRLSYCRVQSKGKIYIYNQGCQNGTGEAHYTDQKGLLPTNSLEPKRIYNYLQTSLPYTKQHDLSFSSVAVCLMLC